MINNGRFQVFFRRRQNTANYPNPDDPLINVIVVGDPGTGEAKYLPGNVDNLTTYKDIIPVGGWYDFTNYVEDTEGSTFTWDKINQGNSKNSQTSKDGSNYDKGISANLFLFDKAFQFVYDWLVLFDYQIVNCVEVKIIDLIARAKNPDPAGNYRIFEIKNDNLDYAPFDENCQFHVKLREQDLIWHCIHKAIIHDDWQKWFNEDGTSVKEHPTFLTCIEPRPRLVQSARMALMMFFHGIKTGVFPIAILIDWITDAPSPREDARRIMNANRFVEAPFIHTLIENVALKCGMTTDTIFDTGREWEKLCLFFPRSGEMHESEDDAIVSPAQTFHWGNRWNISVPDLLDKLKIPFAAEWYVTPQNKIVFAYIKDLIKIDPIYDFTLDDAVPFFNLRYTFNGDKKPAYGEYRYQIDPVDEASQEVNPLYSDTIGFDQANNPMLEGEIQKNFDFAPTGFVRDGRAKDYMKLLIHDGEFGALILVGIIAIIAAAVILSNISIVTIPLSIAVGAMLFATAASIASQANKFKDDFLENDTYTGAVRLTAEQTTVARLLLWDGVQDDRAKVVRRTGLPVVYPYYNRLNVPYNVRNVIDKDNPNALVFNYPLYFDGFYYDNMFTKYHDVIDNPLKSRQSHQTVKFDVELCEDMLNLFGVFQDQYAQIGKILKLEERDNYDVFVRITNILVDYNGAGKIEISGQVIRRSTENPDTSSPGNLPTPIPEDGDPTEPPIGQTCFRWTNSGDVPSTVSYIDCEGEIVTDVEIDPGINFCAFEITSQSPATIVGTSNCDNDVPPVPGQDCERVWRGNLNQTGSDAPFANVFEDTIGGITWTRDSDGIYVGTTNIPGAFKAGKTWWQLNNTLIEAEDVQGVLGIVRALIVDDSTMIIATRSSDVTTSELADNLLIDASLEIRVYCAECVPPDTSGILAELASNGCLSESIQIAIFAPAIADGNYLVDWTATNVTGPGLGSTVVSFVSGNAILDIGETPDGLGATSVTITGIQDTLVIVPCAAVLNVEVDFEAIGAFAFAGVDALTISPFVLSDAMAIGDVVSILWTTSGDGTFDDDTIQNPIYTPGAGDQATGTVTLTMTITTSEAGPCATAVDSMVLSVVSTYFQLEVLTDDPGFEMNLTVQNAAFNPHMWVEWGDGSPLEDLGIGNTLFPSHVYSSPGDYVITVYELGSTPSSFMTENVTGYHILGALANNMYPYNFVALYNVVNLNTILTNISGFTNGQSIITLILSGDPASTDTTVDFTYPGTLVLSNMHTLQLLKFPLLESITNVNVGGGGGSNVTFITVMDCPAFNDLDSANTWKPTNFNAINDAVLNYASLPTMDWTAALNISFGNGTLSVADINQILQDVDAAGTSGSRSLYLAGQTPAATPTGAGATAKANLISRGWIVNTD